MVDVFAQTQKRLESILQTHQRPLLDVKIGWSFTRSLITAFLTDLLYMGPVCRVICLLNARRLTKNWDKKNNVFAYKCTSNEKSHNLYVS